MRVQVVKTRSPHSSKNPATDEDVPVQDEDVLVTVEDFVLDSDDPRVHNRRLLPTSNTTIAFYDHNDICTHERFACMRMRTT